MSPLAAAAESAHEFFLASAGVAGALIGLLFVAISVAPERVAGVEAEESHRVRAASALTAFSNALVVSLFGLIPGQSLAWAAAVVAIIGLLFVAGALVGLMEVRRSQPRALPDAAFLVGLVVVFVLELVSGIRLIHDPAAGGPLETICILVVVCFLVGIARAWELVGGPSFGLVHQLGALGRAAVGRRRGA